MIRTYVAETKEGAADWTIPIAGKTAMSPRPYYVG